MKVCIGILSIGQKYLEEFEKLFKPSVSTYCSKYGYDLKIFTDYLDQNYRQPDTISFQKCLVPSFLMDYDVVVVLDADIYIESNSPPIHELVTDKIGIVNELTQYSEQQYAKLTGTGLFDEPIKYYKKCDFDLNTNKILNTGMMLCKPSLHAEYLKSIYDKHISKSVGHPRRFHYEQSCIGYELQTDNMFNLLPNVWNHIYMGSRMFKLLPIRNQYFIHFAGINGSYRESALSTHTMKSGFRWGINK